MLLEAPEHISRETARSRQIPELLTLHANTLHYLPPFALDGDSCCRENLLLFKIPLDVDQIKFSNVIYVEKCSVGEEKSSEDQIAFCWLL